MGTSSKRPMAEALAEGVDLPHTARSAFEMLTPSQQDGILALMSEPTVRLAAAKAGVNPNQIYRWMGQPDFNHAFREVRWAALRLTITTLAKSTSVAAHRLLLVAKEGQYEKNQVEASKAILDYAFRGVELEELAGRIADLELAQLQPAEHLLGADEMVDTGPVEGEPESQALSHAVQSLDNPALREMSIRQQKEVY